VDCHAHLVNGQLLAPSGEHFLRSPQGRLERQQRQDASLTPGEVEVLAAAAIARALRGGVTLAVEHLHCPAAPAEALEAFARAARALGLRALVSHATSDADGEGHAADHAAQNADFVRRHAANPRVRGALGLNASSTSGEALLERMGALRAELDAPVVLHAAESELDLAQTYERHGARPVSRFDAHGLLGRKTVAALAKAVDRDEADRLSRAGALVALSPRTDALMEPGGGGFEALLARQSLLGLGSAGVGTLADELCSASAALVRLARVGRLLDPDGVLLQMLSSGPSELRSGIFGRPSGVIEPGALADLVVYDWIAPDLPDPIANVALALAHAQVAWTVVGGRVTVREGQLLGHDERGLMREAARVLALRGQA
jgi:cytosine/adenosine deaminase-related metal-dependent hydrolase